MQVTAWSRKIKREQMEKIKLRASLGPLVPPNSVDYGWDMAEDSDSCPANATYGNNSDKNHLLPRED